MEGLIIAGFIALVVGLVGLGIYQAHKRKKELTKWADDNGMTFDAGSNYEFGDQYPNFSCLQQGSNRCAYNSMEGDWHGRRFQGFDYYYETYSTDSKGNRQTNKHYFSAVLLTSEIPLKPLTIRPSNFFDKVTQFMGFDDINFESAEFSRKFHVSGPDRRWAHDVLHARAMEYLLGREMMTIEFGDDAVLVHNGSTFAAEQFGTAAETARGLLDQLPEYLKQNQRQSQ